MSTNNSNFLTAEALANLFNTSSDRNVNQSSAGKPVTKLTEFQLATANQKLLSTPNNLLISGTPYPVVANAKHMIGGPFSFYWDCTKEDLGQGPAHTTEMFNGRRVGPVNDGKTFGAFFGSGVQIKYTKNSRPYIFSTFNNGKGSKRSHPRFMFQKLLGTPNFQDANGNALSVRQQVDQLSGVIATILKVPGSTYAPLQRDHYGFTENLDIPAVDCEAVFAFFAWVKTAKGVVFASFLWTKEVLDNPIKRALTVTASPVAEPEIETEAEEPAEEFEPAEIPAIVEVAGDNDETHLNTLIADELALATAALEAAGINEAVTSNDQIDEFSEAELDALTAPAESEPAAEV